MSDKHKISIRFFNDREVRAVWDDANSKWWFSVLDIIGVLNNQDDYNKNRNYWKYLKNKLKTENPQFVSDTNQLKKLFFLFIPSFPLGLHILDKLSRIAAYDGVWGNVFGNNRSRRHNCVFANSYAGQNGCACAYPSVTTNADGLADEDLSVVKVVVVAD